MKMFRQLAYLTLIFSFNVYSMEKMQPIPYTYSRKEMQKIEHWEAVRPFVNQIVAYTATSNYFDNNEGYTIPNSEIKFGYIYSHNGTPISYKERVGYELISLHKKVCFHNHPILTKKQLRENNFHMRLATKDEAAILLKAIENKDAVFVCCNGPAKYALQALAANISKY